jgi:hypothetical protein
VNSRSTFCLLLTTFTLTLTGCFGGTSYSYQNVTVTLSPQITSLPVNGTQVFTTTTTNAPNTPIFEINNSIVTTPGGPAGSFTPPPGNAEGSMTYTAPATPPIYTAAQVAAGMVQGSVIISAAVNNQANNVLSETATSVTIVITGPVSAGISPTTASLKLGTTQQFTGYSVGSTNNALTWQVNGVTGGSTANGTISSTGLYTAPAAMPVNATTVTITAVAQADTTKSAAATVTLTP